VLFPWACARRINPCPVAQRQVAGAETHSAAGTTGPTYEEFVRWVRLGTSGRRGIG
jgi:hypothetical protein